MFNINEIFKDIIPDEAAQDQKQGEVLASINPSVNPAAGFLIGMPGLNRSIRRNLGSAAQAALPNANIDVRTRAERLRDDLASVNLEDPESVRQAVQTIGTYDGAAAARILAASQQAMQQKAELARLQQGTDASTMSAQSSLINAIRQTQEVGTSRDIVQAVTPEGKLETLFTDDMGNFFNLQNQPVQIPEGYKVLESATLSGARDDLGLRDTVKDRLQDREVATRQFISTGNEALNLLNENPDVNTFVSRAGSVINSLRQEAGALAKAMGMDSEKAENLTNPENFGEAFDKNRIENPRMRSLITSMAFQAAAASGQTGRDVSNRDVERFIEQIGAKTADPEAFKATIVQTMKEADRNFRIDYAVRTQNEFEGDLGLPETVVSSNGSVVEGESVEVPGTIDTSNLKALSIEELLKLVGQ